MRTKMVKFVVPLLALIIFSCEEQALNPATAQKSGKDIRSNEVLTIPEKGKYAVENDDDSDNVVPKCIILPELPDWPTAFFVMEEAVIRGDIIAFTLSYSGGCRIHNFQLVCTTFQESHPVRILAQVFHTNNNDPCDQWVTEERQFDLTPLKELYFEMYDTPCGEIIINLVDATAPEELTVTYEFCQDNFPIPPGPPLPPVDKLPENKSGL